MKTLIIAFSLVLGGCVTAPQKITVPTEVKVLVPVACKTAEPAAPTTRYLPPYNTVFEAVRDLLGDREVTAAYENELRTALKSCK
jgi:hypothetical protein